MVEGVQCTPSVWMQMCSTDLSNHQYRGRTSSARIRVCTPTVPMWVCSTDLLHHHCGGECGVWISHIISTDKGVQYRTTKTAQGLGGGLWLSLSGKIIFYRQSYLNLNFILLWLYPEHCSRCRCDPLEKLLQVSYHV